MYTTILNTSLRGSHAFTRTVFIIALASSLAIGCDSTSNDTPTPPTHRALGGAGGNRGTQTSAATGSGGTAARSTAGNSASASAGTAGTATAGSAGSTTLSTAGSGATTASAGASGSSNASQTLNPKACEGKKAGALLCDKLMLIKCGANGAIDTHETCSSEKLCGAGTKSGTCGACEPGKFDCANDKLKRCGPDGKWNEGVDCVVDICDKDKGLCNGKCQAGQATCDGRTPQKCKPDLTGFEDQTPCEEEALCNSEKGDCYECDPLKSTFCEENTLVTCSKDGKRTPTVCKSPTQYCDSDSAKCVQCNNDNPCKDPGECKTSTCNQGTCATANAPASTPCSKGGTICDGTGRCVQCTATDSSGCKADQQCNLLTNKCDLMPALQVTAALGSYTVIVSPDYTINVAITNTGTTLTTTTNSITVRSSLGFTSECDLNSTSDTSCNLGDGWEQATTLTISGSSFGQGYLCQPSPLLASTNTAVTLSFDQDGTTTTNCEVKVRLTPKKKSAK